MSSTRMPTQSQPTTSAQDAARKALFEASQRLQGEKRKLEAAKRRVESLRRFVAPARRHVRSFVAIALTLVLLTPVFTIGVSQAVPAHRNALPGGDFEGTDGVDYELIESHPAPATADGSEDAPGAGHNGGKAVNLGADSSNNDGGIIGIVQLDAEDAPFIQMDSLTFFYDVPGTVTQATTAAVLVFLDTDPMNPSEALVCAVHYLPFDFPQTQGGYVPYAISRASVFDDGGTHCAGDVTPGPLAALQAEYPAAEITHVWIETFAPASPTPRLDEDIFIDDVELLLAGTSDGFTAKIWFEDALPSGNEGAFVFQDKANGEFVAHVQLFEKVDGIWQGASGDFNFKFDFGGVTAPDLEGTADFDGNAIVTIPALHLNPHPMPDGVASIWAVSVEQGVLASSFFAPKNVIIGDGDQNDALDLADLMDEATVGTTPVPVLSPVIFVEFDAPAMTDSIGDTVTVTGGPVAVTEGGSKDSFTVEVGDTPDAIVEVTIAATADVEADSIGNGFKDPLTKELTLIFGPGALDRPVPVEVNAIDDAAVEGQEDSLLTLVVSSEDIGYTSGDNQPVPVAVTDNDVAIGPGTGGFDFGDEEDIRVNEANGATGPVIDSYTVALETAPTAPDTVTVTVDGGEDLRVGLTPADPDGSFAQTLTLTFTAATFDQPQTVYVRAFDDSVDELSTSASLIHTAVEGDDANDGDVYDGAQDTVGAEVTDNDVAQIRIVDHVQYEEDSLSTVFVVQITRSDSEFTSTVNWATQDDSAKIANSDYEIGSGVANFAPGVTLQTIGITVIGDTAVEPSETFKVLLSGATNAQLADALGIVTIQDDDAPIVPGIILVSETQASTSVGEGRLTGDSYTIALGRQPTADVIITVKADADLLLSPDAFPQETLSSERVLTFTPANYATPQEVHVFAVDDLIHEADPHTGLITHDVNSLDRSYDPAFATFDPRNVAVPVNDDDPAIVTIGDRPLAEGDVGTTPFPFAVTVPASETIITVDYRTVDGTAKVSEGDYQAIPAGTKLTFAPSDVEQVQIITVNVNGDLLAEGDETFTVVLSNAQGGATISDGTGVGTILDDEVQLGLFVAPSGEDTKVLESATATFDEVGIRLLSQPTGPIRVEVRPDVEIRVTDSSGNQFPDATPDNTNDNMVVLFFTPNEPFTWNKLQTVRVHAIQDSRVEDLNEIGKLTITSFSEINPFAPPVPTQTANSPAGAIVYPPAAPTSVAVPQLLDPAYNHLSKQADVIVVDRAAQVTITDVNAANEGTMATFNVRLNNQFVEDTILFTIDYQTFDVTAIAGLAGDFIAQSGSVTFDVPAGTNNPIRPVIITVNDDSLIEEAETFEVRLTLPISNTRAAISDAVGVGTIGVGDLGLMIRGGSGIKEEGATMTEIGVRLPSSPGNNVLKVTIATEAGVNADVTLAVKDGAPFNKDPVTNGAVLFFAPTNFNTFQTVQVTAIDDLRIEQLFDTALLTVSFESLFPDAAVFDTPYLPLSASALAVVVEDNEDARVQIFDAENLEPIDLEFDVRLAPLSGSTLNVLEDGLITVHYTTFGGSAVAGTDYTAETDKVVFAAGDKEKTIIIDVLADADTNDDTFFVSITQIEITIGDDRLADLRTAALGTILNDLPILVSPTNLPVLEGETTTYDVSLTRTPDCVPDPAAEEQPCAVLVQITWDDSQLALSAPEAIDADDSDNTFTIALTSATLSQTVTVEAIEDVLSEGLHNALIQHSSESRDSAFHGVDITNVNVAITDDDFDSAPGIEVLGEDGQILGTLPTDLELEEGETYDYAFRLKSPPTADVTIKLTPESDLSVSKATLTFKPISYNTLQTVTITAVSGDGYEAAVQNVAISHEVNSADGVYAAIEPDDIDIEVTNTDPKPGLVIREQAGGIIVSEAGERAEYGLSLDSSPADGTIVAVAIQDPEGQVIASNNDVVGPPHPGVFVVFFTPQNWDVIQSVWVHAVDDLLFEGPHSATIEHTVSTNDAEYEQIVPGDVAVTIIDNDAAGLINLSPSALTITEGATGTYEVSLVVRPNLPVTITVSGDESVTLSGPEGAPAPTGDVVLVFTPATYDLPQTVTVEAVDNEDQDGPRQTTLTHLAQSQDPNYDLAGATLIVSIEDDEAPSPLIINELGGVSVSEAAAGTPDKYELSLGGVPTHDVLVTITPDVQITISAAGQLGATPVGDGSWTILFTAGSNAIRTISVFAVDDGAPEPDVNHKGIITHVSRSDQSAYDGQSAEVVVAVADDDVGANTDTLCAGSVNVGGEQILVAPVSVCFTEEPGFVTRRLGFEQGIEITLRLPPPIGDIPIKI